MFDIFGARVDQSGTVLDAGGIAVSAAASDQVDPALAFNGADYLVAWADSRSGYRDVYGVRDSAGIVIATGQSFQWHPSVASEGGQSLVFWQDDRGTYAGSDNIYAARVTPEGTVLDLAGIVVASAPYGQASPAAVFDGANYLAAWRDARRIASSSTRTWSRPCSRRSACRVTARQRWKAVCVWTLRRASPREAMTAP